MNVGIVNYGMGNLASVYRAVETIGYRPYIADYAPDLRRAARIILPGVGAFGEGMMRLEKAGWVEEIKRLVGEEKRPLLGICLGMQFLADRGTEGGERPGLGFIGGSVDAFVDIGCARRVPHIGWNEMHIARNDPLFDAIPDKTDFYFVHSYCFVADDAASVIGTAQYGCDFAAAVRRDNIWGTQFHPEKSSKAGLQLLRNFIERS